jgi:hypothetical protein
MTPTIDTTPAGEQCVLPGTERAPDAVIAQRRADAPLKPKMFQSPCNVGLFGDGAQQKDFGL